VSIALGHGENPRTEKERKNTTERTTSLIAVCRTPVPLRLFPLSISSIGAYTMCRISEAIIANMRVQATTMPQHQFDSLVMNALLKQQQDIQSLQSVLRRRRRVSFQEPQVVSEVTPCSSMTPEERSEIWYQQTDLIGFKNEARDLSRRLRAYPEQEEECRGLEHRISFERQKRKLLAIRAIIKAQTRHPDQLAMIASRCTAWAKEIAVLTGHQDFYQAYNPALLHTVPTTLPETEFPSMRKRQVFVINDDYDEPVRRTRPRLMNSRFVTFR
jgi:hypothetical protein